MKRRLLAFAGAVMLASCNPQAPRTQEAGPSPSPSGSASPVALNITGSGTSKRPVRIVQQKGNGKEYDLLASSFVSKGAPGTSRATFVQPHVTFYGKDGSKLVADAPRADVDQSSNIVRLSGGVTAHNSAGMALKCDTLVYNRATQTFRGTGHVTITDRNGFNAQGSQVDSDITLTHTQMK